MAGMGGQVIIDWTISLGNLLTMLGGGIAAALFIVKLGSAST